MRVFSAGFRSLSHPWAEAGLLKGPRSRWTGYLVSRTPTVAPRSLASEHALLRERRVRGPQKLLGPPTARVNVRSEDHVKMQSCRHVA
jgi:hypothetical protein